MQAWVTPRVTVEQSSGVRGLMAPWTSGAAGAMLRKFSPRTDSKSSAVHEHISSSSTPTEALPCSLSGTFAAVLLDDALSRSPTGMATEDAAPPPAAATEEITPRSAPLGKRYCNAASEALKAAESGLLSPRELRLQRAARAATLAAAEASAVAPDGVPGRSTQSPEI